MPILQRSWWKFVLAEKLNDNRLNTAYRNLMISHFAELLNVFLDFRCGQNIAGKSGYNHLRFDKGLFPCIGPMPKAIQDVNHKIYTEWLPNCKDYEIAAGYNVEMYNPVGDYPKGTQDENDYSEI